MSRAEQRARRQNAGAHELPSKAAAVHEQIREAGVNELRRKRGALFWSALAAGLAMSFSMVGKGIVHGELPGLSAVRLLESFGYSIGFIMVVLARQQLFTENTITAVLPVMSAPTLGNAVRLLRLWGVVLIGNLLGTVIAAYGFISLPLFEPATEKAFIAIGRKILDYSWLEMFVKGVVAGWLIAIMVWLLPAADQAKLWVILIVTYFIGVGGFVHIIAGSTEILYLMFAGETDMAGYVFDFAVPALLGNVVGGTFVFALISHAQIRSDMRHGS